MNMVIQMVEEQVVTKNVRWVKSQIKDTNSSIKSSRNPFIDTETELQNTGSIPCRTVITHELFIYL